jgi:hypothetical protein
MFCYSTAPKCLANLILTPVVLHFLHELLKRRKSCPYIPLSCIYVVQSFSTFSYIPLNSSMSIKPAPTPLHRYVDHLLLPITSIPAIIFNLFLRYWSNNLEITYYIFMLSACNIAAPPSLNLLGEIRLLNRLISWSRIRILFLFFCPFFFRAAYTYTWLRHRFIASPCGGGLEYFHRSPYAS